MIKEYNLELSELNFHKKIIKNYKNLLKKIHPKLYELNPILSGSAAIQLVVFPNSDYTDYDFYFDSEKHFENVKSFFKNKNFTQKLETNNCIVFTHNSIAKDIQLIKTFYGGVKNVLNYHDFGNCSIAFQQNKLFIKDTALKAWAEKKLNIQNIQCNPKYYLNPVYDTFEISNVIAYIVSLMSRKKKYEDRYDITLDEASIRKLKPFKKYLLKLNVNNKHLNKKMIFTKNVYYSNATKEISYQKYLNDFLKLHNLPFKFVIYFSNKNKLVYNFIFTDHIWKNDEDILS